MPDIDLTYYRRNLPHRLPTGEGIFITFRLAGSLPAARLRELAAEWEKIDDSQHLHEESYARQKRYFGRYDKLLDEAGTGPVWLKIPAVANAVKAALHFYDGKAYQLVCYCVMANHVHVVVVLPDGAPLLARTLQSIKSFTAQQINKCLNRNGQVWQRESYDHIVRSADEMQRIISYVLENPVKAGLVADWQRWPHTYWAP